MNQTVCVQKRGAGISFAGLTLGAPGFDQVVEDLLASSRPRIVLVHEPEVAERLPRCAADLVLAGHTHGGQITLPGLEPYIVRKFANTKYVEGIYEVHGMPVYVNRGLGTTGLPIRFRARPEVAFITLVR
jgi:predicted MPP superfamily phosphohydrolase